MVETHGPTRPTAEFRPVNMVRVLFVDDESLRLLNYQIYAEGAGHQFTGVGSAEEAIAIINAGGTDVVYTDGLEGGYEAVCNAAAPKNIPVTVVSGSEGIIENASAGGIRTILKDVKVDFRQLMIEEMQNLDNLIACPSINSG